MLKITNDLLKEIKSQNQVWVKIKDKDWEFLYEDLSGKDLIKITSSGNMANSQQEFLSAIVFSGIKDWKNVKLSDIMEVKEDSKFFENKDKAVQFNPDVFDIFIGKNPEIIEDLFKGIEAFKSKEKETLDDRKKKLENT